MTSLNFEIPKQGHTLGNMWRNELLQDSRVNFAAYRIAHPLVENLQFRIRGKAKEDAYQVATASISSLNDNLTCLEDSLKREVKSYKEK